MHLMFSERNDMAFNESAALNFLNEVDDKSKKQRLTSSIHASANSNGFDTASMESFLSGDTQLQPAPEPDKQQARQQVDEPWFKPALDYSTAINNEFLDLVGLPADLYNWGAEKLGVDSRVGDSSQLREMGKAIGMGTDTPGEEPDTGSYRAGQYTAMGLEFLAPFLAWTKPAKMAVTTDQGLKMLSSAKTGNAMQKTLGQKGTTRLVAEKMTAPFARSGKTALAADIIGGTGSGYGSYYGEQAYGNIGRDVGGLAGGMFPTIASLPRRAVTNYVLKSVLPYTPKGGQSRAIEVVSRLQETPEIRTEIEKNAKEILKDVKVTSGKLSKDPHLMALEKVIVDENPALAHELRVQDMVNNRIARVELEKLRGQEGIEEAQKLLTGKFAQVQTRLQARVDMAIDKAKNSVDDISSLKNRATVNTTINDKLGKALKDARSAENALWAQVDKSAVTSTMNTRNMLAKHLSERFDTDDPAEIPRFLRRFLGDIDESGKLVGGDFKPEVIVGRLHSLRKRVLKDIRTEKAGDAVDWNKVRILEDMESAMLKDLADSGTSQALVDATNFSRGLNETFRGGVMDVILRHSKSGGRLAPELTMEKVGAGLQGTVAIKKILNASPTAKGDIEDILKMDIARRTIKNDRVDLTKAKSYVLDNEETLKLFPELKRNLEHAIGQEERAEYFTLSAKTRIAKANKSLSRKVADAKPGTVLNTILKNKYPEKQMDTVLRRMNKGGREAIRNDILDTILAKSKTNQLNDAGESILSGGKAVTFWNENKRVLGKAFDGNQRHRIDKIINTLRMLEPAKNLPVEAAEKALQANKTMLAYVAEVAAARFGAKLGAKSHGASLKTSSQASGKMRDFMEKLDVGTAKSILKDSIQNKELFMALSEGVPEKITAKQLRVIESWLVAHAVITAEDRYEGRQ